MIGLHGVKLEVGVKVRVVVRVGWYQQLPPRPCTVPITSRLMLKKIMMMSTHEPRKYQDDPLGAAGVKVKLYIFESPPMSPADVRACLIDGSLSMGSKTEWWR